MSRQESARTSFDDALSELVALGRHCLESSSALEGWELADDRGNLDEKGRARLAELRDEVESTKREFDALHATLESAHAERMRRLAGEQVKAVENRLAKAVPDTFACHQLRSQLPGWQALARREPPPCSLLWLFGVLEPAPEPATVAAPSEPAAPRKRQGPEVPIAYVPIEVFEKFHSLLREGHPEAAFRLAERALEVCPLDHRLRYVLAAAQLEHGRREVAREHLEALGRTIATSKVLRAMLAEVGGAPPPPRPPVSRDLFEESCRALAATEEELAGGVTVERLLAFARACLSRARLWHWRRVDLPYTRQCELERRDRALAARAYEEVARRAPGHPEAEAFLGSKDIDDGQPSPVGDDGAASEVGAELRERGEAKVRAAAAARPPSAPALLVAASLAEDRAGRLALLHRAEQADPGLAEVHARLGREARSESPPDAVAFLRRAAELEPDDGDRHAELGTLLFELGDWGGAAAALLRACSCRVVLGADHRRMAVRALLALGETDGAARACGQDRSFDGPDALVLEVCARMNEHAGRDDLAEAALEAAIRLEREPFDARLDLALLRARKGDLDGALALCDEARSGRSSLARGEVVTARLLLAKGDVEAARKELESSNAVRAGQTEALELLADVIEAPPEREESGLGRLFDALTSGPKRREESARQKAAALREAAAEARAARTPWPPSSPVEEADCEPPTAGSLARAAAGTMTEPDFRAALALDPGNGDAACHLAQQLAWDGEPARAREVCEWTLAANPRAERVWLFLADLQGRRDDLAAARQSILSARDCAADRCEALLALARLERRTKDLSSAERALGEALGLRPDRADLWSELAGVLTAQERLSEAAAATLQERVWSGSFQELSLVHALRTIPEPSAAERALAEALGVPDPADKAERLGRLLLERGDRRAAIQVLRWLARRSAAGKAPSLRLLWQLQVDEGGWAGLLETASDALACGWPDFEEAFRLRLRALEALRKAFGLARAES